MLICEASYVVMRGKLYCHARQASECCVPCGAECHDAGGVAQLPPTTPPPVEGGGGAVVEVGGPISSAAGVVEVGGMWWCGVKVGCGGDTW